MIKEVFLASGHESGSVVSTRSNEFEPIENYKEIIAEFEESYDVESLGMSRYLIDCSGSGTIVMVINDCLMSNYFEDESDIEGITNYLKQNGNSQWMIDFMLEHSEELYATDIIKALAKPGQTLKIQTSDLEYGNTEFEVTT